jgi:hypothetical protein
VETITDLLTRVGEDVIATVTANWPYLIASILLAAMLTVYVGTDRLAQWLRRRRWSAITGAVVLATLTPFCSCGTTAVILGMLAARTPWAPIVAFMVVSPLTSPSELLLSAGLFGWPFALLYFAGATALGFAAGWVAGRVDDRGWLARQSRMAAGSRPSAGAPAACPRPSVAVRDNTSAVCVASAARLRTRVADRLRLRLLAAECWQTGRRVTGYFLAYTAVGYLLIESVPTGSLVRLLSVDPTWGVPLAALLGIPMYLSTEASLPMLAALMDGGLSAGPAMAFLVTGAGTSVGAVSGALMIARHRVVGLVVGLLVGGAVVLGSIAAVLLR